MKTSTTSTIVTYTFVRFKYIKLIHSEKAWILISLQTHERSLKSSERRALKSEIGNALEEEVNKAFWWGIFHLCGLFLALALALTFILSLRTFIVGFALFFCAFHLGMLSIYLERQSSLKAILQDHFWPSRTTWIITLL